MKEGDDFTLNDKSQEFSVLIPGIFLASQR